MKTAYISAPMTGIQGWNKERFYEVAEYYEKKGYKVLNPAEIDESDPLQNPAWWDYIDRDVRIILAEKPDIIVQLEGWQCSAGALIENIVATMKTNSKVIYHGFDNEGVENTCEII